MKDRKDGGLKKNGAAVQAFLDELTKIGNKTKQYSSLENPRALSINSFPAYRYIMYG